MKTNLACSRLLGIHLILNDFLLPGIQLVLPFNDFPLPGVHLVLQLNFPFPGGCVQLAAETLLVRLQPEQLE